MSPFRPVTVGSFTSGGYTPEAQRMRHARRTGQSRPARMPGGLWPLEGGGDQEKTKRSEIRGEHEGELESRNLTVRALLSAFPSKRLMVQRDRAPLSRSRASSTWARLESAVLGAAAK